MEKILTSEIKDRIVTVDDLLKVYNVSLDEWEITNKVINTWEVGAKINDQMVTTPLFQVKVWLKAKVVQKTYDQIRQEFIEDVKKLSPTSPIKYNPIKNNPKLLEINIFDLHLGKMAWKEETNNSYSTEIACKYFNESIDYFIDEVKHLNIERIVIPVGNDFFNSDYAFPFNRTTKGTPQENDLHWQEIFRRGRSLLIENINKLSQIAPVDIKMIPGNHDYERIFYLGDSLEGWFSNNVNVTVDNVANPRKYYQYGNVLIGYTHGNNEKADDLPLIMAQENSKVWSETKFREFHLGHYHHEKATKYKSINEHKGVVIRYLSSLSATDNWHHNKGYISNKQSAEAFIWDKEKGLTSHLYFNI